MRINNQNINLQNSLELQLLKTIIDDQVDQSSDQDIQKLKQELTDPETTYLQLENHVYKIDWNIDVDKKSMSFELLIDAYDYYYEFKPLELSFQEVAKLTNDRQINQILKAWKTNLNAKTNDQVIYNKF